MYKHTEKKKKNTSSVQHTGTTDDASRVQVHGVTETGPTEKVDFGLTDGLAIHLRIGSAEFRYVGEYRPGKHGPVAVMGSGGLPAIIFSDPYIMVIIPFAACGKRPDRGETIKYAVDDGACRLQVVRERSVCLYLFPVRTDGRENAGDRCYP